MKETATISFRISQELKDDFENFAFFSHTTTKALLTEHICELLHITVNDQKRIVQCKICGEKFITDNIKRKFCSAECRKKNNTILRKTWEFNNRAKGIKSITHTDILEIKKETKCFYCGCELNESNRTIDHLIPLSKGGANIKENIVACCFGCNNKKGTKSYKEFINSCNEKSIS